MVYPGVIWFIDFTPLDLMILDNRITTKNKQSRVDVANFVSAPSGFWLRTCVFFDRMTQYDVAENLIDLFITYGKPDEIWVDGGGELTGNTIKKLCERLGIRHKISYTPRQNGMVEARNRYTKDNYAPYFPGAHTGANLNERPEKDYRPIAPEKVQSDLDNLRYEFNNSISNRSDDGMEMTPLDLFERY